MIEEVSVLSPFSDPVVAPDAPRLAVEAATEFNRHQVEFQEPPLLQDAA